MWLVDLVLTLSRDSVCRLVPRCLMSFTMHVVPVRPIDVYAAWRLLRGAHVDEHLLQQVARDDARRANILGVYDGATLLGAVYAEVLPGAAAILCPPRTTTPDTTLEDQLLQAALVHVQEAKFVQVFLDVQEMSATAALQRHGFRHITNVAQRDWPKQPTPPTRLRLQPGEGAVFRELLWECHMDSADVPEMNDVRTLDETLAGYRDVAPDLGQWFLAFADTEPVGVLILQDTEICFLGVRPRARQRGYGRELLRAAAARTSTKLTLIVDVRNTPALQLYQSFGFVHVAQRAVFLRLCGGSGRAMAPHLRMRQL